MSKRTQLLHKLKHVYSHNTKLVLDVSNDDIGLIIAYMLGRNTWSICVLEEGYCGFVVKVEENANVDEVIELAMKQLINRYSEEVINELLQRV